MIHPILILSGAIRNSRRTAVTFALRSSAPHVQGAGHPVSSVYGQVSLCWAFMSSSMTLALVMRSSRYRIVSFIAPSYFRQSGHSVATPVNRGTSTVPVPHHQHLVRPLLFFGSSSSAIALIVSHGMDGVLTGIPLYFS